VEISSHLTEWLIEAAIVSSVWSSKDVLAFYPPIDIEIDIDLIGGDLDDIGFGEWLNNGISVNFAIGRILPSATKVAGLYEEPAMPNFPSIGMNPSLLVRVLTLNFTPRTCPSLCVIGS
jgi:hypothetical protein